MHCGYCGTKCSANIQFCVNCGKKLIYTRNQKTGDDIPVQSKVFVNSEYGENLLLQEENTPKTRFPVAGIFLLLHGLILIYCSGFVCHGGSKPVFVGTQGDLFLPTLVQLFLICITAIFLFRRKNDKLVKVFLLLCSIGNMIACIDIISINSTLVKYIITPYCWHRHNKIFWHQVVFSYLSSFLGRPQCFILPIMEVLSYIALTLLILSIALKGERFSAIMKKLWYLPGVFACFGLIGMMLSHHYYFISRSLPLILCEIAETFLLGWWLVYPYKKQHVSQDIPQASVGMDWVHDRGDIAGGIPLDYSTMDAPSFEYMVLGFFLPVVGLVLYIVWKDQMPLRAKSAGRGALIGTIVAVSVIVLLTILSVILPLMMFKRYL